MSKLSQLLAVPELGLKLIQSGPEDPEITWGSVTELLDLGGYLEGGEIIMTTGLALAGDDSRWLDFVASLSRARVAAIGFGVGVNHATIPLPLLQACSTYRVALFEVPLPTPFIAVSKAIAGLLRADELRLARNALTAQERILQAARSTRDHAEVLASIAGATGRQLAVRSRAGRILAATGGFSAASRATGSKIETVNLDASGGVQLVIAGDTPLTPEGRQVIAAGAMVLAVSLQGDSASATRERERWGRLVRGILRGEYDTSAVALLDPEQQLPARVRVIAVQGAAEDIAAWRARARAGGDRLVALDAGNEPAPGLARAWQLTGDLPSVIQAALDDAAAHELDAVVGRAVPLAAAPQSYASVLPRLQTLSPTAPLYAEPRIPAQIFVEQDTPVLDALLGMGEAAGERIARDILGPLAGRTEKSRGGNAGPGVAARDGMSATGTAAGSNSATDSVSTTEKEALLHTLHMFFQTDGQRGPAAQALGIHRNTLRDRLGRIEQLTGKNLSDPAHRAELWFALQLQSQH